MLGSRDESALALSPGALRSVQASLEHILEFLSKSRLLRGLDSTADIEAACADAHIRMIDKVRCLRFRSPCAEL